MSNIKNRKEGGFTIIEVLIVLAIAGLIMLIVFLAVPALQRNSRNTQRKNDVSNLLGAVNEFTNNNGGVLPTAATDFTGNAKLGYYATGDVTYVTSGGAGTATDKVYIVKGYKCSSATATPVAGSSRQVAAWYYVENSTTTIGQCQEG